MPLNTSFTDSVTRHDRALGKGMNCWHTVLRADNLPDSIGRLASKCLRDLRLSIAGYHLEKGISIQLQIKALVSILQLNNSFVYWFEGSIEFCPSLISVYSIDPMVKTSGAE